MGQNEKYLLALPADKDMLVFPKKRCSAPEHAQLRLLASVRAQKSDCSLVFRIHVGICVPNPLYKSCPTPSDRDHKFAFKKLCGILVRPQRRSVRTFVEH